MRYWEPVPALERVELIDGLLHAGIIRHELLLSGHTSVCWTALTQGLRNLGQREIAISVPDPNENPFPGGLLDFFATVGRLAQEGRFVGPGDITAFGLPGPFDFGGFVGAIYSPATSEHDVPVPPHALQAILLREGEVEMAALCSTWRVLARIGEGARYFPWPFWSDPARPTAYQVGDAQRSVLSQVRPLLKCGRLDASLDGSGLVLTISDNDAKNVAAGLGTQQFAVIVPEPDPTALATMVWAPDQSDARAISADPARTTFVSVRFLIVLVGQSEKDEVYRQEDGWSITTSPSTGEALMQVLNGGGRIEVTGMARTVTIDVQ